MRVCRSFHFQDLESSPGIISFSKNGNHFGTAFSLPIGLSVVTLYPIIYTKNVLISMNFNEVGCSYCVCVCVCVRVLWCVYVVFVCVLGV